MFTGVAGFEMGIKGECIGMSEIDKYASQVLKYRFPNIKNYGDCKTINWSDVSDFDLLVGGSPCQDLSVAGKRAGITGERSGLFTEFIRALQEKKPKYFIWENVKGTLSSNQGWDFAEVQAQMAEAGYSIWWQVLNAKDFGVPQNRERIFVVGTRGERGREVLFERGDASQDSIANTIRTGGKASITKKHAWDLIQINKGQPQGNRVYSLKGISSTITAQAGGKTGLYEVDTRVRRLTPRECERLMSWPDDWTRWGIKYGEKVEMSDTQRYKMCGNGVVSEVVKQVYKQFII